MADRLLGNCVIVADYLSLPLLLRTRIGRSSPPPLPHFALRPLRHYLSESVCTGRQGDSGTNHANIMHALGPPSQGRPKVVALRPLSPLVGPNPRFKSRHHESGNEHSLIHPLHPHHHYSHHHRFVATTKAGSYGLASSRKIRSDRKI